MRRALAAVRPRLAAPRRALAAAVRLTLAEIVVPVGVTAAAGLALAATISPGWRAAGMPYLLGYGKNVEAAAVAGADAGAVGESTGKRRASSADPAAAQLEVEAALSAQPAKGGHRHEENVAKKADSHP